MFKLTIPGSLLLVLLVAGCRATVPPSPVETGYSDIDWPGQVVVYAGPEMIWPTFAQEEVKNRQARAKLREPMSFSFSNANFASVLGRLREDTGLNIMVNWESLEIVGIVEHSPVTMQLEDVPAEHLLRYTLDTVSAEQFDGDKAGYEIIDGVVYISTNLELRSLVFTRVYDIRTLLNVNAPDIRLLYPDRPEAVEYALTRMGEQSLRPQHPVPSQSDGPNGGLFGDDGDHYEEQMSRSQLVDQFTELIQETVGTMDEWLDEESTMRELNGWLIVKTSRRNHLHIESLLASFHKAQADRFQRKARLVEVFGLLKRAEAYRLDQRYAAALGVLDQALAVDPENVEALALREIVAGAMGR